ncbi:MAG: hypothetical protein ABI599_01135 [Flavobacteriales bacterium]
MKFAIELLPALGGTPNHVFRVSGDSRYAQATSNAVVTAEGIFLPFEHCGGKGESITYFILPLKLGTASFEFVVKAITTDGTPLSEPLTVCVEGLDPAAVPPVERMHN